MLLEDKSAMLHFIYNKNTVSVLVNHDIKQGEFVLQVPFYPPVETIEDYKNSPEKCLQVVRDAL